MSFVSLFAQVSRCFYWVILAVVFVVSWVNPDASYAHMALEDYIQDGYLTAFETARAIAESQTVNAIGYCIGGTTLALTLAFLKQRGENPVSSATFFTTLTDFSQKGDFLPFLQNDFVDGIEKEVEKIADAHDKIEAIKTHCT